MNTANGYCECGCGEFAPIARQNDRRWGWIKGQPVRFVLGHVNTGKKASPETRAKMSANRPSAEARAKMSAAQTGRVKSPAECAAISARQIGQTLSAETRARISATLSGTTLSPEHRAKVSEGLKGSRNPRWKGGITPAAQAARNSQEQRLWSKDVLARDAYTCQDCGTRGGHLHAHHIVPFATHPELRTILENGVTLCPPCHRTAHARSEQVAA